MAEIVKDIYHDKRAEVRQQCTVFHLPHYDYKPEEIVEMQAGSNSNNSQLDELL